MASAALSKPWSVDQFRQFRPALTSFIQTEVFRLMNNPAGPRRILIRAQVKVGKREMVEYIAMCDQSLAPARVHCFISAFHRAADADQRDELERHNLKVFSLHTRTDQAHVVRWIKTEIERGREVIVHYDEADYGSADRQRLSGIWGAFRENEHVRAILYSATPEELMWSTAITQSDDDDNFVAGIYEDGVVLNYTPPEGYCGARRFLDEGLVTNAKRFFRQRRSDAGYELTAQGREILEHATNELNDSLEQRALAQIAMNRASRSGNQDEVMRQREILNRPVRNIITLRLPYLMPGEGSTIERKAIYRFLKHVESFPELADTIVMGDKDEGLYPDGAPTPSPRVRLARIEWSRRAFWDSLCSDKLLLVVMDQTSSRSTEWCFHDRLIATHEFREGVTFSVTAQAQLRVAHYEARYGGFQRIRVYGHLKTFMFAASQINVEQYMNNEWSKKKTYGGDTWTIIDPSTRCRHPDYPEAMNEIDANDALEDIGCDVSVDLSSRVRGAVRQVPVVEMSRFYACTPDTFQVVARQAVAEAVQSLSARAAGHANNDVMMRYVERLRTWSPQSPFAGEPDAEGHYPTLGLGDRELIAHSRDEVFLHRRNGFSMNGVTHRRVTACYDGDSPVGFVLRYVTGEKEVATTLEAYKSMYCAPTA